MNVKKRKTTTVKTNSLKIKDLIEASGKPINKLADNIKDVSEKSIQRMAKGEAVGEELIDSFAKYFKVNTNEICEKENFIYLDRLDSFNDLINHEDYALSRKFADSKNHKSHKIYKIEDMDDAVIADIQSFLEVLYSNTNDQSSDKGRVDDVKQEIEHLKKMSNAGLCFKRLLAKGVGIYYGHYNYYHISEAVGGIADSILGDDVEDFQYYLPNGKRIEIIYFYQVDDYKKKDFSIPNKIKIFPDTGTTLDNLKKVYFDVLSKINEVRQEKKKNLTSEQIEYSEKLTHRFFDEHSKNCWLTVPAIADIDNQGPDDIFEVIPPLIFINNRDFDLTNILSKDFNDLIKNGDSIPKYSGPVEVDANWVTWSSFMANVEEANEKKSYQEIKKIRLEEELRRHRLQTLRRDFMRKRSLERASESLRRREEFIKNRSRLFQERIEQKKALENKLKESLIKSMEQKKALERQIDESLKDNLAKISSSRKSLKEMKAQGLSHDQIIAIMKKRKEDAMK